MVQELTIFVPSAFDLVRSSGSSKEEVIRKSPGLPRVHGIAAKHYATGEIQFIYFYSEKKTLTVLVKCNLLNWLLSIVDGVASNQLFKVP